MATALDVDKISTWLKDWFPQMNFSKQEIKEMCRGPMKDVFLEFLVPRFRTEEEISVIRSNLFAYGIQDSSNSNYGKLSNTTYGKDKANEKYLARLNQVNKEKELAELNLLEQIETLRQLQTEKQQQENMVRMVALKRKQLQNLNAFARFSDGLIQDLQPFSVDNINVNSDTSLSTEQDTTSVSVTTETSALQTIQLESMHLFQAIFFDEIPTTSPSLKKKNLEIHNLVEQFVKLNSPNNQIISWHENELQIANKLVVDLRQQFDNKLSLFERIKNEARAKKISLTKEHVASYKANQELENQLETISTQRINLQMDILGKVIGSMTTTELLKSVRVEELKSQINKCREISDKHIQPIHVSMDISTGGGDISCIESEPDYLYDDYTQEKLEKITSALLRNWPESKSKLSKTAKQASKLMNSDLHSTLLNERDQKSILDGFPNNYSNIEDLDKDAKDSKFHSTLLNPDNEHENHSALLCSFSVHQYNSSAAVESEHRLSSLCKELQLLNKKHGTSNLEILDSLIENAEQNMSKFQ